MNNDLRFHGLLGGGGGSNIKSIQGGVYQFTGYSTDPVNVPISEVDLSKSIVKINGTKYANAADRMMSAQLLNSTTLRLKRNAGSSSAVSISWEVIEFDNVKSLQTGSFSINSTADYVLSINAVNPLKSILDFNFNSTSTSDRISSSQLLGTITDETHVTFMPSSGELKEVYWYVVEFN